MTKIRDTAILYIYLSTHNRGILYEDTIIRTFHLQKIAALRPSFHRHDDLYFHLRCSGRALCFQLRRKDCICRRQSDHAVSHGNLRFRLHDRYRRKRDRCKDIGRRQKRAGKRILFHAGIHHADRRHCPLRARHPLFPADCTRAWCRRCAVDKLCALCPHYAALHAGLYAPERIPEFLCHRRKTKTWSWCHRHRGCHQYGSGLFTGRSVPDRSGRCGICNGHQRMYRWSVSDPLFCTQKFQPS